MPELSDQQEIWRALAIRYVNRIGAKRIAMLVDDTANGAFTKARANRLTAALRRDGASVSWTSVRETSAALPSGYYADRVARARATNPDLVSAVERELRRTRSHPGATGTITIDRRSGYRTGVPVRILRVNARKRFVIAQ